MFYGRGAGGAPTASAVFGDVVDAARQPAHRHARIARHAHHGDRSARSTRPAPSTSSASTWPIARACSTRSPACSPPTTCQHPRRRAGGQRTRRPARVHHPRGARSRCPGDRPCAARARRRAQRRRPAACDRRLTDAVRLHSWLGAGAGLQRRAAGRPGHGRRAVRAGGLADAAPAGTSLDGRPRTYVDRAVEVMLPFVEPRPRRRRRCGRCATQAYSTFRHPAITPLVQIDHQLWVQELFHGPTLAFKDVALQLVGRCSTRCSPSAASGSRSSAQRAVTPGRRRSTRSPAANTSTS